MEWFVWMRGSCGVCDDGFLSVEAPGGTHVRVVLYEASYTIYGHTCDDIRVRVVSLLEHKEGGTSHAEREG